MKRTLSARRRAHGPLLDLGRSPPIWTRDEVEDAWDEYRADLEGDHMAREAPGVDPYYVKNVLRDPNKKGFTYFRGNVSASTPAGFVKVQLTPVAREDLAMKLKTGRGRRFPAAATELKMALKQNKDKIEVTEQTAAFIKEELEDSLRIISHHSFADEPWVGYHRLGLETALDNLKRLGRLAATRDPGPASAVRRMVLRAREEASAGEPLDLQEIWSLVSAAQNVLKAKKGKCPEAGCVVKRDGKWRVMSNKTGKLWPQTYKSKDDASDAITAYHMRKKGIPPA